MERQSDWKRTQLALVEHLLQYLSDDLWHPVLQLPQQFGVAYVGAITVLSAHGHRIELGKPDSRTYAYCLVIRGLP
jgi:hypothetical protein